MSQDTNVSNLIINKLTKAQYEGITTPDPTQLYFVTDDSGITSSDITTALGYTPYNGTTNPNGYTSNVGTVTSVNNVSPVNGNVTLSIPDPLPSQTSQSGKFLTTNGTTASWATVDTLPSQTSQSGKFLTTNGTTASWASISIPSKISDLTDDTATYPIDKADTLTGLTATITELNYVDGVTSAIQTQLNGKQASITSSAMLSSDLVDDTNNTHKFATAAQLTQIGTNQTDISTINGKIPSAATSSNQLADKAFVNSSVQTATANFRGNWDTWALVPTSASSYPADYAGSTTPTVNDYLVVQDASGYTGDTLNGTWRFKYSGTWSTDGKSGWLPEYQVNETPLTSDQIAALNSGITSSDVTLIGTALQSSDLKTINSVSLVGSGDISIVGLPSQTSQSGKFLTTNGTTASWADVPTEIPSQSGNSGKYLTTNGSVVSWATVDTLPTQTSQSGKFLTTDGTTASWATVDALPSQTGQSGKFLTTNGTSASWATVTAPSPTYDSTNERITWA